MYKKSPVLPESEIADRLAHHPEWDIEQGILSRTFAFADFITAMRFVNAVAEIAETVQHHPDFDIRYNKVTLGLTTHDSGGITEKDFSLASEADQRAADLPT